MELVTTLLREHGWKVDVAPRGRSALERLRAAHYDFLQATGAPVLEKPFTSEELLRAIRKLTS